MVLDDTIVATDTASTTPGVATDTASTTPGAHGRRGCHRRSCLPCAACDHAANRLGVVLRYTVDPDGAPAGPVMIVNNVHADHIRHQPATICPPELPSELTYHARHTPPSNLFGRSRCPKTTADWLLYGC